MHLQDHLMVSRMDAAMDAAAPSPVLDPSALLEEAKVLVNELYNPRGRTPADLKAIQERLQVIQKTGAGWQVADGLLAAEDTDMRFFGALTFTVKINHDWQELGSHDIEALLAHLVDCFVELVNKGEKPLVIRKLSSTLVAMFLKPNTNWKRAICDLAASLSNRNGIPKEEYLPADFEGAALPALQEHQIISLLRFSTTMAEETVKWAAEARKCNSAHPISDNVKDAFTLCDFVIRTILRQFVTENPLIDVGVGVEALESYRAWLNVRANIRLHDPIGPEHLETPMKHLVECLSIPGMAKAASEILTDMLGNEDKALTEWHLNVIVEYLVSDKGMAYIVTLLDGDYIDEAMTFLELVLAYSSARQVDLICGSITPIHEKLLSYLDTLFHGPGYPGAEDKVSPLLLEWWTEAADELQEISPEQTKQVQLDHARRSLANAVLNCFGRLLYPSREQLLRWDDDERSEYHSFRRDARDFLLAAYPTLGVELVQLFQQRTMAALEAENWKVFEAAVFCLSQLSEAVDGNELASQCLNEIFYTDQFGSLCADAENRLPLKARQTLVDMLGKYEVFFERNQTLLPRVLTFLFASLNVPLSTNAAARSISSLCKSCRAALTSELRAFLTLFAEFRQSVTATTQNLDRVVEGIAAVIQALDTDEAKVPYLNDLIGPFAIQAATAAEEAARGDLEAARSRAHLALTCIASIGRGLRADAGPVIDLDGDGEAQRTDNSFWISHPCQHGIILCLRIFLKDFPLDVVVVEGVCQVLQAGFTEKTGLFVFPSMTTTMFLTSIPLTTAGAADVMMSTASAFLASHQTNPSEIHEEAGLLIVHVYYAFLYMLENPDCHDPEVSNSGIGFLTRLLPKYYPVLFSLTSSPPKATRGDLHAGSHLAVLPTILDFTINALHGRDPLPLRSATQFWAGVLSLPVIINPVQPAIQQAIHDYLPALCHVLIQQMGGQCARSDLNHLSEVLKKIIFKHQGAARPHLAAALALLAQKNGSSIDERTGAAIMSKEQDRFLSMVIGARGSSATNQLVKSFWLQCRGAGYDYTG